MKYKKKKKNNHKKKTMLNYCKDKLKLTSSAAIDGGSGVSINADMV